MAPASLLHQQLTGRHAGRLQNDRFGLKARKDTDRAIDQRLIVGVDAAISS